MGLKEMDNANKTWEKNTHTLKMTDQTVFFKVWSYVYVLFSLRLRRSGFNKYYLIRIIFSQSMAVLVSEGSGTSRTPVRHK